MLVHQYAIAQTYEYGINFAGAFYSNNSTIVLPCGVQTVRAFVQSNPVNTDIGYSGNIGTDYPPGWQIAQDINSVSKDFTTNQSGGGKIKFRGVIARPGPFTATEPFDVEINIARPVPNLSVVGDALLCSGQTKTYTLNGSSSGDQINWSTPLGGSSSGTQFNATFNGNNGSSFVTANVTTANGCGTFSASNSVWAGTPGFQEMTYGTQGNGQTNTVYTVNSVSAGTWYVIRTNTDNAQMNSGPS